MPSPSNIVNAVAGATNWFDPNSWYDNPGGNYVPNSNTVVYLNNQAMTHGGQALPMACRELYAGSSAGEINGTGTLVLDLSTANPRTLSIAGNAKAGAGAAMVRITNNASVKDFAVHTLPTSYLIGGNNASGNAFVFQVESCNLCVNGRFLIGASTNVNQGHWANLTNNVTAATRSNFCLSNNWAYDHTQGSPSAASISISGTTATLTNGIYPAWITTGGGCTMTLSGTGYTIATRTSDTVVELASAPAAGTYNAFTITHPTAQAFAGFNAASGKTIGCGFYSLNATGTINCDLVGNHSSGSLFISSAASLAWTINGNVWGASTASDASGGDVIRTTTGMTINGDVLSSGNGIGSTARSGNAICGNGAYITVGNATAPRNVCGGNNSATPYAGIYVHSTLNGNITVFGNVSAGRPGAGNSLSQNNASHGIWFNNPSQCNLFIYGGTVLGGNAANSTSGNGSGVWANTSTSSNPNVVFGNATMPVTLQGGTAANCKGVSFGNNGNIQIFGAVLAGSASGSEGLRMSIPTATSGTVYVTGNGGTTVLASSSSYGIQTDGAGNASLTFQGNGLISAATSYHAVFQNCSGGGNTTVNNLSMIDSNSSTLAVYHNNKGSGSLSYGLTWKPIQGSYWKYQNNYTLTPIGAAVGVTPGKIADGTVLGNMTGNRTDALRTKVVEGHSYGDPTAQLVGNRVDALANKVVLGYSYGDPTAPTTGNRVEPTANNVVLGVTYGDPTAPTTGNCRIPSTATVVGGVPFGPDSAANGTYSVAANLDALTTAVAALPAAVATEILATPDNKLATDASGRVSVNASAVSGTFPAAALANAPTGPTYNLSGVVPIGGLVPLPLTVQRYCGFSLPIPVTTSQLGKQHKFAVTSMTDRGTILWSIANANCAISADGMTITVTGTDTNTQAMPATGWYWFLIDTTGDLRIGEGPLTLEDGPNVTA